MSLADELAARGVRRREVRIVLHPDGGATLSGTRWGDGSWAWLSRGWTWDSSGRVWRLPESLGAAGSRVAVERVAAALVSIGFAVVLTRS